jgi:hypothetical protein
MEVTSAALGPVGNQGAVTLNFALTAGVRPVAVASSE